MTTAAREDGASAVPGNKKGKEPEVKTPKPPAPTSASTALTTKGEKGWLNFWGKGVFPEQEEIDQMLKVCSYLIKAQLVPQGLDTPEKLMVVFMNAREMGIPPMTAVKGMYPVKGKVALEGWLALALIRTRIPEAKINFTKVTDKEVSVHAWRPGMAAEEWEEFTFTWADAETAHLTYKKGYDKAGKEYNCSLYPLYPKDMLGWKAISRMVKKMFSDVTNGCPLKEDVQEVIDAEIEEQRSLPDAGAPKGPAIPSATSILPPKVETTKTEVKVGGTTAPPVAQVPAAAVPHPAQPESADPDPGFGGEMDGTEECSCWHSSKAHKDLHGKCSAPKCGCEQFQFMNQEPAATETPELGDAAEVTDEQLLSELEVKMKAVQVGKNLIEATQALGRLLLDFPHRLRDKGLVLFISRVKGVMDLAKDTVAITQAMQGVPEILRDDQLIEYYHVNYKQLQKGEKARAAGQGGDK